MSIIDRLQTTYDQLNAETVHQGLLADVYDPAILFIDPMHRIEGLPALEAYFSGLYRNVTDIRFQYLTRWEGDAEALLRWEMTFAHPSLRRGAPIRVPGVTHLTFADRITRHQDYFDTNQMIFDHVPVLGGLLGWLKHRLND